MKKVISVLLSIVFIFSFVGCSSQTAISNGGYTDISLVRDSKEYKIKRLKEVKETAKAVFGIPVSSVQKRDGMIFRFNGLNLNQVNSAYPIYTFVAMLAPILTASISNASSSSNLNMGALLLPTLIAVPIAGAINNLLWRNSAITMASFNVNSRLIYENPNIDVFTNPKYEIENDISLWTQTATVKAKVMGAILKTDDDEEANSVEKIITNTEIEKTAEIIQQTIDSTLFNKKEISQPEITEKTVNVITPVIEEKQIPNSKLRITYPTLSKVFIDSIRVKKNPYYGNLSYGSHKISTTVNEIKLEKIINVTASDNDENYSLKLGDELEIINKMNGKVITIKYPVTAKLYIDGIQVNNKEFPYKGVISFGVHSVYAYREDVGLRARKNIEITESMSDPYVVLEF